MKIWTSEHIFSHPWETVTQAAWRKYPNPFNPAVVGTDVLDRRVIDGVLHSHRLISSQWGLPGWAQSLLGSPKTCYASEHSRVDPKKKEMVLETTNLTFCKHVAIDERLVYARHPDDPNKTLLRQEAEVRVRGVPLTSYVEDILTSSISGNASKGRDAMEMVIGKINLEVRELAELASSAAKTTDEFLHHTKRSLDDLTITAKKSLDDISHTVDDLSSAAKKLTVDDLSSAANLNLSNSTGSIPKL